MTLRNLRGHDERAQQCVNSRLLHIHKQRVTTVREASGGDLVCRFPMFVNASLSLSLSAVYAPITLDVLPPRRTKRQLTRLVHSVVVTEQLLRIRA